METTWCLLVRFKPELVHLSPVPMTALQDRPTTVAICEDCGDPIASRELPDGVFLPIGTGKECPCGCTDFRRFG
ncbi:hypothetical protein CP556_25000 [Natrinema sp. CBA1119]|nr:hypothetical protein CP556_25000 [Natrinema sp. CBA1119]